MLRRICFLLLAMMSIWAFSASKVAAAPALTGVDVRFKDTLQIRGGGSATNTISLKNLGSEVLHLEFVLDDVPGWRPIGKQSFEFDLAANASKILPISLGQVSKIQPELTAVHFVIRNRYKGKAQGGTFYLRVAPITKFELSSVGKNELIFTGNNQKEPVKFRVTNSGNREMRYTAKIGAQNFGLNEVLTFTLPPQRDTTLSYAITNRGLTRKAALNKEIFQVTVIDDSLRQQSLNYQVLRTGTVLKPNASSYRHFPLRIETGGYSRTESKYLYGQISGEIPFNDKWNLSFLYRTEDYTDANVTQPNIFSVQLQGPRLGMYVGQITRHTEFFTFGNEASVYLRLGKTGIASLYAMKPFANAAYSGYYNNREQAGADISYTIGRVRVTNALMSTLDSAQRPASAILLNKFSLLNTKNLRIDGNLGIGMDSVTDYLSSGTLSDKLGYWYGGSASYTFSKLTIAGSGSSRSLLFPGISRGATNAYVSLQYAITKKLSIAPYYSTNRVINNFGIDTLLNSNRIQYNNDRVGLMTSYASGRTRVSLGLGRFKDANRIDLPNYNAIDLVWTMNGRNSSLQVDSRSGISSTPDSLGQSSWFNSSTLTFRNKYLFIFGNYYRYPIPGIADASGAQGFSETLSLVLGGQYTVFKRLTLRSDYTVARYSVNNSITHNLRGMLTYRTRDGKLQASVDGSMPLFVNTSATDNASYLAGRNYLQVSLVKNLNVPVFGRKKYVNMKMSLFADDNGNGVKDDEENYIHDGRVLVNGFPMLISRNGRTSLLHCERGPYSVNLSQVSSAAGYIPATGYSINIDLQDDQTINIPFAQGKLMKGSVVLLGEADSKEFKVEGLKIIVSDSSRIVAYAMTDELGQFRLALPTGKYSVALNEEAFGEKFKPVQVKFPIDLLTKATDSVQFQIKPKKREIRFSQNVAQKIVIDTTIKKQDAPVKAVPAKGAKTASGTTTPATPASAALGQAVAAPPTAAETKGSSTRKPLRSSYRSKRYHSPYSQNFGPKVIKQCKPLYGSGTGRH